MSEAPLGISVINPLMLGHVFMVEHAVEALRRFDA
jgi:hypothetical protein